jgi:hypothetical protein
MRTTKWNALAALVVVGSLSVAAGAAYATIPDDQGVIHACYTRSGGALRVIDASVRNCFGAEYFTVSTDTNQLTDALAVFIATPFTQG